MLRGISPGRIYSACRVQIYKEASGGETPYRRIPTIYEWQLYPQTNTCMTPRSRSLFIDTGRPSHVFTVEPYEIFERIKKPNFLPSKAIAVSALLETSQTRPSQNPNNKWAGTDLHNTHAYKRKDLGPFFQKAARFADCQQAHISNSRHYWIK